MKSIYHFDRLSSLYPPKYITSFAAPSLESAVEAFVQKGMEGTFNIRDMNSTEMADFVIRDGELTFKRRKERE